MNYKLVELKKDLDVLGLYSFYYFEHPKDFYFSGEKHDFWEMVYVDKGQICVIADNKGYTVNQGEVIFHKPMEFHTLAGNKKEPPNVMVISFAIESKEMAFFENKIFAVNVMQKRVLSMLLDEAKRAFGGGPLKKRELNLDNSEFGSQQLVLNHLEQFLIMVKRNNQINKRDSRKSNLIKKNVENILVESILEYLSKNIYNYITLSDVCKQFNMSQSYICHVFKETTGKSVIDVFIHLKIEEAKILIRRGDYNFTQISQILSYTSLSHFTRTFKKIEGMSPGEYAKSVK